MERMDAAMSESTRSSFLCFCLLMLFCLLLFSSVLCIVREPGSEAEIESFCSLTYGVSFPVMAKIEVNGDDESPVYKFLKSQKSGVLGLKRIKWYTTHTLT